MHNCFSSFIFTTEDQLEDSITLLEIFLNNYSAGPQCESDVTIPFLNHSAYPTCWSDVKITFWNAIVFDSLTIEGIYRHCNMLV